MDSCEVYVPKSVLVTGGCGFIASNFVQFLTSKHESLSVINVDRMTYCSRAPCVDSPLYKLYKTDLCNSKDILSILERHNIDTVVHFAAQTHVDRSFGNSLVFTNDNVRGTHSLLECIRAHGKIRRFVHISTDEVYGEVTDDHSGCEEQSLLNPTNPYAATKAAAEFLVRSYGHSFGIPYIITRGNNVYGEMQYPDKLIPKFISSVLSGTPFPIHGDGSARRNFIHAEDVCKAVWTVLESGGIGEIYNIGSDDEFSVMETISLIYKKMKPGLEVDTAIEFVRDRDFNDHRYCINTNRLRSLGWKPHISFSDGIERAIAWYSANKSYWLHEKVWLVYGARGWIGKKVVSEIEKLGDVCVEGLSRANEISNVMAEIDKVNPDRIISVLGRTHGPGFSTIDYLEQPGKCRENIRDNLFAPIVLARCAEERGIHFTYLGTGCIFTYDDGDQSFGEGAEPNFFGSQYSIVKGFTDQLSRLFPNMLNCRIRMPISSDESSRNFIMKITSYEKIHSVPNSMTVLDELLPLMVDMGRKKEVGTVNLTNPGVISHNEILEAYKKIVDPNFTYENFSGKELLGVIAAARSNNKLETTRLEKLYPNVTPIEKAVTSCLHRLAKKKVGNQTEGCTVPQN